MIKGVLPRAALAAGLGLGIALAIDALRPRPAEATPLYTQEVIKQHVLAQGMAPLGTANCSSSLASCSVASITVSGTSTFPAGTAAAPSLVIGASASSGLYSSGSGFIDIATSGVNRMTVYSGGVQIQGGAVISSSSSNPLTSNTGYSTGNTYTSTIASGSNGFACTTNGCRYDIGSGASDYFVSDGSTISSPASFQVSGNLTTSAALDVTGSTTLRAATSIGTTLAFSATAPTVTTACSSPTVTHGRATSFQVDVGTSCAATTTIVLGLPTATNGWECTGYNKSNALATLEQSADTTASATMINYTRTTGVALAFTDGNDLVISCTGR